jgi:hypothetical protein
VNHYELTVHQLLFNEQIFPDVALAVGFKKTKLLHKLGFLSADL